MLVSSTARTNRLHQSTIKVIKPPLIQQILYKTRLKRISFSCIYVCISQHLLKIIQRKHIIYKINKRRFLAKLDTCISWVTLKNAIYITKCRHSLRYLKMTSTKFISPKVLNANSKNAEQFRNLSCKSMQQLCVYCATKLDAVHRSQQIRV